MSTEATPSPSKTTWRTGTLLVRTSSTNAAALDQRFKTLPHVDELVVLEERVVIIVII